MDKVVKAEVIVKYLTEDGIKQSITFNLSNVQINQSMDMKKVYDEESGEIIEYVEDPNSEGISNIVIKGKIMKQYEN